MKRLEKGLPLKRIGLAVAAWMIYVGGRNLDGTSIDVRDPMALRLQERLAAAGMEPEKRVAALLGERAIFSEKLAEADEFRRAVVDAYASLMTHGARAACAVQ